MSPQSEAGALRSSATAA